MKKIGVLTLLYQNYNYGGILQAYALIRYLCMNGYDAKGILYAGNDNIVYPTTKEKLRQYEKKEILKKFYQKIENKLNYKKIEKLISKRKDLFLEFQNQYIPVSPVYNDFDLYRIEKEFDFFISGSDQVWNPNCAFSLFLQTFVKENKKKVSYAASISRNSFSDYEAKKIIPYIKQFEYCSVREKTAKKILENNGIADVEITIDPTFLLTSEQWNEIIPKKEKSEKYVFAYFFSNSKKYRAKIQKYCKENILKLYYLPYAKQEYISTDAIGNGIQQENIGPLEFLGLIRDAEIIFTDSFHGVALSVNLKKEFIVFERDSHKSKASMNSRIYDILNMFGLENRLISNTDDFNLVINEKINYRYVENILDKRRIESENFLKKALSNGKDTSELLEKSELYFMPKKFYAAYSKENAANCSSGGIFACIAKKILKNKGIVYGVGFDESFNVVYKRIDDEKDINDILGSKYVRSKFTNEASFKTVLKDLKNENYVLFSGVGCLILALKKYLQENNCSQEKLITVEVVCHGAPAANMWAAYRKYLEKKYKSQIADVNFRDKKYGWKSYSMYIKFRNNVVYRKIMNADPYMQIYFSGYSVDNSCVNCKHKRNDRIADITLGDLWGISIPEFQKVINEGVSLVAINTDKGLKIYDSLKNSIQFKELGETQKIVALSNMMGFCKNVSKKNKDRINSNMREKGFIDAYKEWKKNNKLYYWINNIKALIKKYK